MVKKSTVDEQKMGSQQENQLSEIPLQ